MLTILISIIVTWIAMSALYLWKEETDSNFLYDLLDGILLAPMAVLGVCLVCLCFPFMLIWKFFRNAIKGVTVECWEKAKIKKYWKLGNLYFCWDSRARAWQNKLFLVRVVEPANRIIHTPRIEVHNEPSVPSGEFR